MENLIDTENISLDFNDARDSYEKYRLSVFDKYGHYLDEIYLSKNQLSELFDGLKNVDLTVDDEW